MPFLGPLLIALAEIAAVVTPGEVIQTAILTGLSQGLSGEDGGKGPEGADPATADPEGTIQDPAEDPTSGDPDLITAQTAPAVAEEGSGALPDIGASGVSTAQTLDELNPNLQGSRNDSFTYEDIDAATGGGVPQVLPGGFQTPPQAGGLEQFGLGQSAPQAGGGNLASLAPGSSVPGSFGSFPSGPPLPAPATGPPGSGSGIVDLIKTLTGRVDPVGLLHDLFGQDQEQPAPAPAPAPTIGTPGNLPDPQGQGAPSQLQAPPQFVGGPADISQLIQLIMAQRGRGAQPQAF